MICFATLAPAPVALSPGCKLRRRYFPLLVCALLISGVLPSHAQKSRPASARSAAHSAEPVTLNFSNAEIEAVARTMAVITGRNVVVTLPGGDLEIEWRADDRIFMTGPVEVEHDGVLEALEPA